MNTIMLQAARLTTTQAEELGKLLQELIDGEVSPDSLRVYLLFHEQIAQWLHYFGKDVVVKHIGDAIRVMKDQAENPHAEYGLHLVCTDCGTWTALRFYTAARAIRELNSGGGLCCQECADDGKHGHQVSLYDGVRPIWNWKNDLTEEGK